MLYIHQSCCISHQPTYNEVNLEDLKPSENNLLYAIEPKYEHIPLGQLRRMGRALRMGVGTAMKLLSQHKTDGIIIGTANGGIEDSILFLNQINEYSEGRLTPTAFVQSTYNAIAGMAAMITANKGYNVTHVHRGQTFENVVLDAAMLLRENPEHQYLIGGVDEISPKNHRIVTLGNWYRDETVSNSDLYSTDAKGTLAGEGAAMFIVNNISENANALVKDVCMVSSMDEKVVKQKLKTFIGKHSPDGKIDLLLQGENGDNRLLKYYNACEELFSAETTVARFKHAFGEFQTVPALALWLACYVLQNQNLPKHFIKEEASLNSFQRILIYNNYQGVQHGIILVEKV